MPIISKEGIAMERKNRVPKQHLGFGDFEK